MRIEKKEFVTEVRDAISVSELCKSIKEFGEPCMLIVYMNSSMVQDAGFPSDLPFITAAAVKGDEERSASKVFDLVIPAEDTEAFTEKLFKDKTKEQIMEINKCFIAARKGSQEEILECESRAFYRLMAAKNGGSSND